MPTFSIDPSTSLSPSTGLFNTSTCAQLHRGTTYAIAHDCFWHAQSHRQLAQTECERQLPPSPLTVLRVRSKLDLVRQCTSADIQVNPLVGNTIERIMINRSWSFLLAPLLSARLIADLQSGEIFVRKAFSHDWSQLRFDSFLIWSTNLKTLIEPW
jgi:hypothetical protein